MKTHTYETRITWTGNSGSGTSNYRAYSRNHEILGPNKPVIAGSSDPAFRGDPSRYNPEELLVASVFVFLHHTSGHICVRDHIDMVHSAKMQVREHMAGRGTRNQ